MRVRLSDAPDGGIYLEASYRDWSPVLDHFKATIPSDGRGWDQTTKKWVVRALYIADLLTFLHGYKAQVQDDRQPAQDAPRLPMPEELRDAFTALHLAPSAPLCVAEASYRALSKYYHPDHGGVADDFHRVNDAIATVRSYLNPQEETNGEGYVPF
jgi:hypothetical protein